MKIGLSKTNFKPWSNIYNTGGSNTLFSLVNKNQEMILTK